MIYRYPICNDVIISRYYHPILLCSGVVRGVNTSRTTAAVTTTAACCGYGYYVVNVTIRDTGYQVPDQVCTLCVLHRVCMPFFRPSTSSTHPVSLQIHPTMNMYVRIIYMTYTRYQV